MKPKCEQKAKVKKAVIIKSSLRMAPILVNGGAKAGKGAARRRMMKGSRLVRHAKSSSTAYPPAEAMLQRIPLKAAASLMQRAQESDPNEAEKVEATNREPLMLQRGSTEDRTVWHSSSSNASTRTARDDLKKALITKAAIDKEKLICKLGNSKNPSTSSTKDGQKAGPSVRDRGQGSGFDLRPSERESILRLLAL